METTYLGQKLHTGPRPGHPMTSPPAPRVETRRGRAGPRSMTPLQQRRNPRAGNHPGDEAAVEAQNFQPSTPDLTPDPIVPAPGQAIPGSNAFSSL